MNPTPYLPGTHEAMNWLQDREALNPSYPEIGGTQYRTFPAGYDHDRNSCHLGDGKADFVRARQAIRSWRMFPAQWTRIMTKHSDIEPGMDVIVMFRLWGLWWKNSCRVIYVIDEPRRFGFAYGTVDHIEHGEEVFWVEWKPDGSVWYHIEAFSRPKFWGAKLLKGFARRKQRAFVRESKQGMKSLFSRKRRRSLKQEELQAV
ncbi:DUF1990 domain-containing protein [Pontibacter sp. G13]|uniref:DUF1990 family protein n=1 Tax=Pontibacter sp. G13 TaxID=3074898 RepID=UPI00288AC85F|nr:DUF1990 domain-containing protein [Pontibacter sp. G13]WNJ19454.1 DUF1990 domain-containing protein [Pontibacter sp. G13]